MGFPQKVADEMSSNIERHIICTTKEVNRHHGAMA